MGQWASRVKVAMLFLKHKYTYAIAGEFLVSQNTIKPPSPKDDGRSCNLNKRELSIQVIKWQQWIFESWSL